jgi:hypothetical protein
MKWIFTITILVCIKTGLLVGQTLEVYPGDVTNNGEVNNLDFLHLGMAYNFAGPARDSSSQLFEPLPVLPWSYYFANGQNMAYADCNGDGVVNYYYDAFPLYTNYGSVRNTGVQPDLFFPGLPGIDPVLGFDHAAVPNQVQGGQLISLPLELGTMANPVEDLYGIAFSMIVDPQYIDANSVMFNLSELSWANPDNDRIWMYKKVSNQRVDVGWVRTDKNQRWGSGKIGSVDFVIIVDILPLQQQFPVYFENIKMMDKFGNYSTVAADTIWLNTMADSTVSSIHTASYEPPVSVMPNPAQDKILVRATEPITGLMLSDVLGQIMWQDHSEQGTLTQINLPDIPAGTYLLRIETDSGLIFKRLQIQH